MYRQPIGRLIGLGLFLLYTSALSAAPLPLPSSGTVTIQDCYQKALKVSETLLISEEEIRQLTAVYRAGVGSVLPSISWHMDQLWQDTSGVQSSSGDVQGTLLRGRRPESFFQLYQPIFSGFKEFNAIKGFKAANEGARYQKEQAALNLLADVAEVFYTSLDLQQELDVLNTQRDLTNDRLKELERRVRLGRSRDSEVLSSQVEMASLEAQIDDTRQRWATARQTLYFLTEVPETALLQADGVVPSLIPIETAISKSSSRPDLLAAERTRTQESFRLQYAKGGFYPTLDFTGKYYTERVGFNDKIKWDALLALDVPIFSGFRTKAEVQQARSTLIIADLRWAQLKRMVRQQVETAHQNLRYTLSQAGSYARAVELAQRNYKLQQDEYRLGLINNLQVIQVMNDLQDLQLRKLRADAAVRLNEVRLRVAMGESVQ